MAIRFELEDGTQGTFDVQQYAMEEHGPDAVVTGVKDGVIHIKTPEGVRGFSLAGWAEHHGATITLMEGFNNPDTALKQPPNGLNYLDQSIFFQDGSNMDALQELYPKAMKNADGSVVVLDNDGLWKTMWASDVYAPEAPLSTDQEIEMGLINDPRMTLRSAGVVFLFGLAGFDPETDKKNNYTVKDVVKMLQIIGRNAPHENKHQIGKLVNQTTGLDPWKFTNALLAPVETGEWLNRALTLNSFQFRMNQADMSELMVSGMRSMAQKDFQEAMDQLLPLDETKKVLINLKQLIGEFIQFLVGLDLLRDISRSTGLNEWIAINESSAYDPSKLPPMPEFVDKFVKLLRWAMPIVKEPALAMARGKKGFKAIMALMIMIDDCVFSLAGVPDSTAKYKMFMGLKKLQTGIESKLAFNFHPDPLKNKDGLLENPFMMAKEQYKVKREMVYKLCQTPKEAWNNTLLTSLRAQENLEQFYDGLPETYRKLLKSFAAMDAAYDMQPWVDVNHAERTHDAFSQLHESFGLTPPEAGYLAKNSPRAVFNIAESLIVAAGFLSTSDEMQSREVLRNPWMLANLIKVMMTASVNREVGAAEIINQFGFMDPQASPDANRIWEDPEQVAHEQRRQLEEMMGQMAMDQMAQQNQQQSMDQEATMMQEAARDGMMPEDAGAGPMGPPSPAMPMR